MELSQEIGHEIAKTVAGMTAEQAVYHTIRKLQVLGQEGAVIPPATERNIFHPAHITAKTISDAWFQIIYNIFDNSYRQDIQQGSFEKEQYRLQYPGLSIFIEYPWLDMVPLIPAHLGIPAPTTEEYIQDYFATYLMDPDLSENETYRYASRIHELILLKDAVRSMTSQLDAVINMLRRTPLTNQATIEIGKPEDIVNCYGKDGKLDPPCLRVLDFKAIPHAGELALTVNCYFRSWDLWAGLPTNLGGIELLKQYISSETGLQNGPMYAYTAGGHIYGYQEEMARIRTVRHEMSATTMARRF